MNKLPKTLRAVIIAGVILLGTIGVYFYVWMAIQTTSSDADLLSANLEASIASDQTAKEAETLLVELSGEKKTLEGAFLDDDKLVGFLEQIEGLGTTTGSRVRVLSVDSSTDKQSYRFSISAEGSWQSTYHVLKLIEASPIPVIITMARLERQGGDASRWQELIDFTAPHLPQ